MKQLESHASQVTQRSLTEKWAWERGKWSLPAHFHDFAWSCVIGSAEMHSNGSFFSITWCYPVKLGFIYVTSILGALSFMTISEENSPLFDFKYNFYFYLSLLPWSTLAVDCNIENWQLLFSRRNTQWSGEAFLGLRYTPLTSPAAFSTTPEAAKVLSFKSEFTRGPGRGDTCHLSVLDETLPDWRYYPITLKDKVGRLRDFSLRS